MHILFGSSPATKDQLGNLRRRLLPCSQNDFVIAFVINQNNSQPQLPIYNFPSSSKTSSSSSSYLPLTSPGIQSLMLDMQEDIVIVGAGIAGLATALGLHRLGIRSVVLESSDGLRVTGYALTMLTNAWRAVDALGIGDLPRGKSVQIQGFQVASRNPRQPRPEQDPEADLKLRKFESRCVKRRDLLEALERELPHGTIRYSSKMVSIEESGSFKLVHLADGSVLRTKVLIGCDGVNSVVAEWLGLPRPVSVGRSAIRGLVDYPDGHGFEPKLHAFFGGGVRYGFVPCDDRSIYWFCTSSLFKYDENERDPLKMKQFVLSHLCDAPKHASDVVERTSLDFISCASLKVRLPWNILLGNIVKSNVCVVGDALHPMTPDIAQGGCSALEDSVVLARCLAEALLAKPTCSNQRGSDDEEYTRIKRGLEKYAKERRWRSFSLISTAYLVGLIQESGGKVVSFLRSKFLAEHTVAATVRMADFDCGKLTVS